MKAIRVHSYDGPDAVVYEEVARPSPAAGQVLVKVFASSVNAIDSAMTSGYFQAMIPFELPFIPGFDLAGVVEEVGEGVSSFAVGDPVYGFSELHRQASYAEYVAVGENELVHKPDTISFIEAGGISLAAITAWQGLFEHGHLQAGQTVLIHGAGGGVGSFAVQFAVAKGARVLATASSSKIQMLRDLGVHEPIDYTTSRFEDIAHDVDLVFDAVGKDVERSLAVIKRGGAYISAVGHTEPELAAKYGVRTHFMFAHSSQSQLSEINQLIAAGKVKPIVSEVVPLAELPRAFALLSQGHTRGKIALQVAE
jgi:NADPH:quinone reductase-like Zn-dependent oxidoreductase